MSDKIGEICIALSELDDRYIFGDSDPSGFRVHIPKPATVEEIRICIQEALLHNDGWIADVITENLDDETESETRRMTTYRRMIEANDNEGETWSWWLATAGNETALDRLKDFLIADGWDPSELGVAEDELSGPEVDTLVRFAEVGYHKSHNKVDGRLKLPEILDEDFVDALYKGGIRDFFGGGAE